MRTNFSPEQLLDPDIQQAHDILRKCVHCGMCTATCPTYQILGDELDSPRGRIYLIKDWLESAESVHQGLVTHIDRCLSCFSCMTTCPADVDYRRLSDMSRVKIAQTWKRPFFERLYRAMIVFSLSVPWRFRLMYGGASLLKPFKRLFPSTIRVAFDQMPDVLPINRPSYRKGKIFKARSSTEKPLKRIALLPGCVQPVLSPTINEAAVFLLSHLGYETVITPDLGCCGALAYHSGDIKNARQCASQNIKSWMQPIHDQMGGLDGIVMTASGCGSMVHDYAHLFADEPEMREQAKTISEHCMDASVFFTKKVKKWPTIKPEMRAICAQIRLAYHAPCSLQHGQKIVDEPVHLLKQCGFQVYTPQQAHMCCGSAGTYALFQPDLSERLKNLKQMHLNALNPDIIVSANIGCIHQLNHRNKQPVIHWIELLAWAYGGAPPSGLKMNPLNLRKN
ncbi:MAG: glycolate oxidase subunit GlcF [Pseudomonadota bacterium]